MMRGLRRTTGDCNGPLAGVAGLLRLRLAAGFFFVLGVSLVAAFLRFELGVPGPFGAAVFFPMRPATTWKILEKHESASMEFELVCIRQGRSRKWLPNSDNTLTYLQLVFAVLAVLVEFG